LAHISLYGLLGIVFAAIIDQDYLFFNVIWQLNGGNFIENQMDGTFFVVSRNDDGELGNVGFHVAKMA
jgi:hypothetical protein